MSVQSTKGAPLGFGNGLFHIYDHLRIFQQMWFAQNNGR